MPEASATSPPCQLAATVCRDLSGNRAASRNRWPLAVPSMPRPLAMPCHRCRHHRKPRPLAGSVRNWYGLRPCAMPCQSQPLAASDPVRDRLPVGRKLPPCQSPPSMPRPCAAVGRAVHRSRRIVARLPATVCRDRWPEVATVGRASPRPLARASPRPLARASRNRWPEVATVRDCWPCRASRRRASWPRPIRRPSASRRRAVPSMPRPCAATYPATVPPCHRCRRIIGSGDRLPVATVGRAIVCQLPPSMPPDHRKRQAATVRRASRNRWPEVATVRDRWPEVAAVCQSQAVRFRSSPRPLAMPCIIDAAGSCAAVPVGRKRPRPIRRPCAALPFASV